MESSTILTPSPPSRPEHADDAELAARFRAGDAEAFDAIVLSHQERIARLVRRLLDGAEEVEDVVQEVFLAVLQNRPQFRGESRLSTWLTSIAVNKCRSHRRRRLLWTRALGWIAGNTNSDSTGHGHARPDEVHEEIHRAVRRLPAKYREPIVLRYFEQMPLPQIGEVLGTSTGAIEVRLSRARRRLKEILANRLERG